MKLKISIVIGCLVGMFTIIGGLTAFDDRYAKDVRVSQIEHRLDRKILTDRLFDLRERMWKLEDRYGESAAWETDEYRRLKQEWEQIDSELGRE